MGAIAEEGTGGPAYAATLPIATEQDIDGAYCAQFLRAIRDVSFATVDERGFPAVRIIDVMMVEDDRVFFLTARGKAFYSDLMREKYVAIVGQSIDYRTVRLRGTVEHPEDPDAQHTLIDRMFQLNPQMNELYPGDARHILEAFCIVEGKGEYFDLGQKPLLRVSFEVGKTTAHDEGYRITDACTCCGECSQVCPASCISVSSSRFHIDANKCFQCGLCFEVCRYGAVGKTC